MPSASSTAVIVSALTITWLPCQSQYSVATPDARASSVSAGEGAGVGTSSLSEGKRSVRRECFMSGGAHSRPATGDDGRYDVHSP